MLKSRVTNAAVSRRGFRLTLTLSFAVTAVVGLLVLAPVVFPPRAVFARIAPIPPLPDAEKTAAPKEDGKDKDKDKGKEFSINFGKSKNAKGESVGEKHVVPFELLPSNHIVIKSKVNGKGPYWLVFDVGAPITLLNLKACQETGVKAAGRGGSLFGIGGEAKVGELQVGEHVAKDIPVIMMNHPVLGALSRVFRPVSGIIGYTFFARYRTVIDYQARVMTLEAVDFPVRNLMQDMQQKMMGPREAEEKSLAPQAFWGWTLGKPAESFPAVRGIPVVKVVLDSPVARAGVKVGDRIMSLDGRWITSVTDAYDAASRIKPLARSILVLEREGRELTVEVAPSPGF